MELIIALHNTHEAIMGERKLLDSGVAVMVMPTPRPIGPACGMCLRVAQEDIEKVQGLLGETIAGIFQRADETGKEFIPWNT
ncbi:hypothetical protein FACS1894106_0680 [Spirochaetia bacterium]|nr:hypothetical protein FACS1894106_0680 [Spirochaetia bacterium]